MSICKTAKNPHIQLYREKASQMMTTGGANAFVGIYRLCFILYISERRFPYTHLSMIVGVPPLKQLDHTTLGDGGGGVV